MQLIRLINYKSCNELDLIAWQPYKYLNFSSLHFSRQASYFSLNAIEGNYLLFLFHHCTPPSQHHTSYHEQGVAKRNYTKDWNGEKPSAWIILISDFVAAQDALPTHTVVIWHPGNETQQSTVVAVGLGIAGTIPTHSTFKVTSLYRCSLAVMFV